MTRSKGAGGILRSTRFGPRARGLLWTGVLLTLAGCGNTGPAEPLTLSGPALGDTYSITLVDAPESLGVTTLREEMRALLARVDVGMSGTAEASPIDRFNRAEADVWVPVSAELAKLVQATLEIGRRTSGAFDVTASPLLELWGLGGGGEAPATPPGAAQIHAARERTGIGLVEVREEPPAVRKTAAGLTLDMASIAQGYIVDRMAAKLAQLGASHYRVKIGSAAYVRGENRDGQPWQIGVEQPQAGERATARIGGLENEGLAVSGGRPNFMVLGGRRFSRTIDPRTGRPVAHGLRSVAVIASTAARADALAAALLVMGPRAGLAYANANGIAARFVSGEPDAHTPMYSDAFEPYRRSRSS